MLLIQSKIECLIGTKGIKRDRFIIEHNVFKDTIIVIQSGKVLLDNILLEFIIRRSSNINTRVVPLHNPSKRVFFSVSVLFPPDHS